jgi:hypothetical protein
MLDSQFRTVVIVVVEQLHCLFFTFECNKFDEELQILPDRKYELS